MASPSVVQRGTPTLGKKGHGAGMRPKTPRRKRPKGPARSMWKMWVSSCVMTSSIQSSKYDNPRSSMGGRAYTVIRLDGRIWAKPLDTSW